MYWSLFFFSIIFLNSSSKYNYHVCITKNDLFLFKKINTSVWFSRLCSFIMTMWVHECVYVCLDLLMICSIIDKIWEKKQTKNHNNNKNHCPDFYTYTFLRSILKYHNTFLKIASLFRIKMHVSTNLLDNRRTS